MSSSWAGGEATVWCEDGHDGKIVQGDGGTYYECPECGKGYEIEVDVTPLDE